MRPPLLADILADILASGGPTNATPGAHLDSAGNYIPALQQRLPSLQVFAFDRRFVANVEMAGWTADVALRALPSTLDDSALATFLIIPRKDRSTLQKALDRMALVGNQASLCKPDETPLAYQSALMVLAQAAYPRMDYVGLDTIVLEKILLLARELRIAIHVKDEAILSSLLAAHYLHTELLLQRDGQVAACATHVAMPENAPLYNQAFASQHAASWRATDGPRQGVVDAEPDSIADSHDLVARDSLLDLPLDNGDGFRWRTPPSLGYAVVLKVLAIAGRVLELSF
ncbi:unnamed protein product [Lampetra fluviatilis]